MKRRIQRAIIILGLAALVLAAITDGGGVRNTAILGLLIWSVTGRLP